MTTNCPGAREHTPTLRLLGVGLTFYYRHKENNLRGEDQYMLVGGRGSLVSDSQTNAGGSHGVIEQEGSSAGEQWN